MKFSTKKAITFLSAMGFMFSAPLTFAQDGENLVVNGSFESIDKKQIHVVEKLFQVSAIFM